MARNPRINVSVLPSTQDWIDKQSKIHKKSFSSFINVVMFALQNNDFERLKLLAGNENELMVLLSKK